MARRWCDSPVVPPSPFYDREGWKDWGKAEGKWWVGGWVGRRYGGREEGGKEDGFAWYGAYGAAGENVTN